MLSHIHLVEIAPIVHLRFHHLCQIGHRTLYSGTRLLVAIVSRITTTPAREDHRYGHFQLRHPLLQTLNIFIVHAPPAPFAESLVRLSGLIGSYNDCILCKTLERVVELFPHCLSASHQTNEHEHPPEHAESRKKRTRLVTCQRIEDFSV